MERRVRAGENETEVSYFPVSALHFRPSTGKSGLGSSHVVQLSDRIGSLDWWEGAGLACASIYRYPAGNGRARCVLDG